MRVTVRALRIWFCLAGVIGVSMVAYGIELLQEAHSVIDYMRPMHYAVAAFCFLGLPLALAQLWVSLRLPDLLQRQPRLPVRVTWLGMLMSVPRLDVFGFLIGWFISRQLTLLAREADLAPEQRILE